MSNNLPPQLSGEKLDRIRQCLEDLIVTVEKQDNPTKKDILEMQGWLLTLTAHAEMHTKRLRSIDWTLKAMLLFALVVCVLVVDRLNP